MAFLASRKGDEAGPEGGREVGGEVGSEEGLQGEEREWRTWANFSCIATDVA